ncbi:MAG: hypothetical protein ABJM36_02735 [Algibacter sp.]|uniref:DUF7467 domain-containing protein n=1 Tax=Algibacter sp. TaxID=1872428 RepID=UPI003297C973
MKKIIFSMLGISLLFLSCEQELVERQEVDSLSFSTSSSLVSTNCEPDLEALDLSLPETVTVKTKFAACSDTGGAFLSLDIAEGELASLNNDAYCADLEGTISIPATYTYDVYSSYEDLSGLEQSAGVPLFENASDFDKINWLLNQDIIGTESPLGGTYTFGHIQWAIWEIIEGEGNNCTNDCDYLSCDPIDQWDLNKAYNESLGLELVAAAEAGEGFVPQCGQQIAIVLASTTSQSLIITVDVPEKEIEEECLECEGNVTELELQYNGDETATIKVETKDKGENGSKVVFEGNVAPGDSFTIYGNDENGTFGKEIKVYVDGDDVKIKTDCSKDIGPGLIIDDIEVISGKSSNGAYLCPIPCQECDGKITRLDLEYNGTATAFIEVVQKKDGLVAFSGQVNAGETFTFSGKDDKGTLGTEIYISVDGTLAQKIHTSCSVEIGAGSVFGDFTVIGGASRNGGELCPVDTPPNGGDDCNECDGKITRLDLQYNGAGTDFIEVVQKKDGLVAFSGHVSNGDTFTFTGKDDKGTLGTEIYISVNGALSQKIHTSCSVEIGAGSVFGDFTVMGGASRNGGELCPVDTPPNGGDDCSECDGKVTRLDLQYNGGSAFIEVVQKKDGLMAFSGQVNAGETFTFSGKDDKGTLGTEIHIYINGALVQKIHTSCSVEIGAGAVFGDFTVIGGASRNGGELCPVDTPPVSTECDCDGKIVKMSVVYDGPSGAEVVVTGDKGGSQTFTNVPNGAVLTPTLGEVGNWWYYTVNGTLQASIHTSCSDDILGNVDAEKSIFGSLGNFPDPADDDGNKNDGTFYVTSHTDDKGNTCNLGYVEGRPANSKSYLTF